MAEQIYSFEIKVPESSIDELGHVNNVVYLEWVQLASQKHWESRVPKPLQKEGKWVVLNHFISYKSASFKNDVLVVKTWVESMEGVKSKRHVSISKKADDKLVVKAETLWCYIDAETHRPKRISPALGKLFLDQ